MLVYNLHALIHLARDCRRHGPLDDFSSFKYENMLWKIKRKLRSTSNPLRQLENRFSEAPRTLTFTRNDSSFEYVPKGWLIGRDCSMWPKTSFAKMERMRSEEVDSSKTTDVEWREYSVYHLH